MRNDANKQKQPSRGVLRKKHSREYDVKVWLKLQSNFIEFTLRHMGSFAAYFQNNFS